MENIVDKLFSELEKETNIALHRSPVPLKLHDTEGNFEGYYAFYKSGAVRAEVQRDEIIGVAVWTKPGNLNSPTWHFKTREIDALGEVDLIAKAMQGKTNFTSKEKVMAESKLVETAKDDIDEFMKHIGEYAYDKKLSVLYTSYEQWAEINSKKRLSSNYFFFLTKEWLVKNKQGKYKDFEITKGNEDESTEINSSENDTFLKDVMENEVYYKASLFEHAIRRIAQDDPLVNSIFVCGPPGTGKTFTVKKILKEEGVENKTIYKTGSIAGFTGLLQVLWDNRKGRILVLDDCDNLLTKKNDQQTLNILKAALNTKVEDRVISYIRMKHKE